MATPMDEILEKLREMIAAGPEAFPRWAIPCFTALGVLFIYTQFAISYTHGSLVGTLAMIEDPTPTAILRPSPDADAPPPYADDPDAIKQPQLVREEEMLLIVPKPLTSSNRATIRHLKRVGGRLARFRGLPIALLYGSLTHWIGSGIHRALGHGMASAAIAFVFTQMALFRLNMLWTHIIISAPSNQRWYRRFVPGRVAHKVALPTLVWALVHVAIPVVLVSLMDFLGLHHAVHHDVHRHHGQFKAHCALAIAAKSILVALVAAVLVLGLYVPANVALTRCHAALLAPHEEPIVSFDRSFGGRVSAETPRLRLKDAWRSFDWNGRIRLVKVYAKTLALLTLTTGAFAITGGAMVVGMVLVA